jgi:murein DD-endopeptidase MepM/ murein hydrolase activator NlpD
MPRLRPIRRVLAVAAALVAAGAALAIPALAGQIGAQTDGDPALRVMIPGGPAAMAAAARREAGERRLAVAPRKRRRQPDGPFVPVVGKVDYGTSENGFGASRSGHVHAGQDMFAPTGTPLVAVADGFVADAGSDGGQGNYVHLYDPKREQTYVYMHLVAPAKVTRGDDVHAGEQIGGLGCTGSCWGDHLHFEIRDGKGITAEAHDPLPALESWDTLDKPL